MQRSESIGAIAAALAKFQGEVKQPKKDANNPYFSSKYVPLEGVVSVITEPLAKNGLSYIQSTATIEEQVIIKTLLMHESGEWIETDELKLPAYQVRKDGTKDFNPQGIGAAITYGRRYSLSAALGIASEDDDDGNTGAGSPDVTPKARQQQGQANTQNQRESATGTTTGGNTEFVTEGQSKMLYSKLKAGELSVQRLSDFLGYELKDTKQVKKADVNKALEWIEKNALPM